MASDTTTAAPTLGTGPEPTTISELRAALARFPAEISAADANVNAAQVRAAELRATQKTAFAGHPCHAPPTLPNAHMSTWYCTHLIRVVQGCIGSSVGR